MTRSPSGLLRQPDFLKLWFGQTISTFGSRTDVLALVAVLTLAATPEQMGVLTALIALPSLLFSLPAGTWVDRLPRRPLMIACDLARFALLVSIPLAFVVGQLSFALVCGVAMLSSICALIFELAYRALLPTLVERGDLLEGNTRLATTDSLAEIGGPAVGGVLVQILTAPLAVLVDAATFLVSAFSVAAISPEVSTRIAISTQTTDIQRWRRFLAEIRDGFRIVTGTPVLRAIAVEATINRFFGSFFAVLYSIYVVRDLGLSPAVLGMLIACGGIGALPGAMLAGWLARRYSPGRVMVTALIVTGLINLTVPLAGGSAIAAALILMVNQIVHDGAYAVYSVNEITLRQMLVPEHMLGRANASIAFVAQVLSLLGALVCGLLAGVIGARWSLTIAVIGMFGVVMWVALSPLRRVTLADITPQP